MIELELKTLTVYSVKPSKRLLTYGVAGILVIAMCILGTAMAGQMTKLVCNQRESGRFVCEIELRGECPRISSYMNFIIDALKPLKYDAECLTMYEIPVGAFPEQEVFLLIGLLIIIGGFIRAKNSRDHP